MSAFFKITLYITFCFSQFCKLQVTSYMYIFVTSEKGLSRWTLKCKIHEFGSMVNEVKIKTMFFVITLCQKYYVLKGNHFEFALYFYTITTLGKFTILSPMFSKRGFKVVHYIVFFLDIYIYYVTSISISNLFYEKLYTAWFNEPHSEYT